MTNVLREELPLRRYWLTLRLTEIPAEVQAGYLLQIRDHRPCVNQTLAGILEVTLVPLQICHAKVFGKRQELASRQRALQRKQNTSIQ